MKRLSTFTTIALLLSASIVAGLFAQQRQLTPEQQAAFQAQQEATRKDHQQMMAQLKIASLRPGANPNDPKAPNAVNYDESKANPYPNLPDSLVLKNGKKVASAKVWWNQRRPEIIEDFDREVYGRVPKTVPKVKWEVVSTTNETKFDVPVIVKQIVGHVDNSAYPEIAETGDLRRADASLIPHARAMARLAAPRLLRGEGLPAENAEPLYIRDKVALKICERGL